MKRLAIVLLAMTGIAAVLLSVGGRDTRVGQAQQAQICATETTTVTSADLIEETVCISFTPLESAKIRLVDFTNNFEVQRDLEGAAPQMVNETVDKTFFEWLDEMPDRGCDGTTEKNWPVAYKRNSQVKLDIKLCVTLVGDPAPAVKATVRGVAKVKGGELVFEKAGVPLVQPVTSVAGLTSAGRLPNEVTFIEPMTIKWTVIIGEDVREAGSSTHNVYTTLKERGPRPIYFTVIDLSTHGADGATTEPTTIAGVWSKFKHREAFSGTDATLVPAVHRREFDPVSGAITTHDNSGTRLKYWDEVAPDRTLAVVIAAGSPACPEAPTAESVLREIRGRCGAWGDLLRVALDNHGITANEIHLGAKFDAGCPIRFQSCYFLVKNWDFADEGTSGEAFPYKATEVTEKDGIAGQGVKNPPPLFRDHAIVKAGDKYYDPSYGTGPFNSLAAWETASIAGYCKHTAPNFCQKNPDGNQVETLSPPTNLIATPLSATRIRLSWTPTADDEVTHYKLSRSTRQGGPYTQIGVFLASQPPPLTNSELKSGTTYYYVMRSFKNTVIRSNSPFSEEVSVTTP